MFRSIANCTGLKVVENIVLNNLPGIITSFSAGYKHVDIENAVAHLHGILDK